MALARLTIRNSAVVGWRSSANAGGAIAGSAIIVSRAPFAPSQSAGGARAFPTNSAAAGRGRSETLTGLRAGAADSNLRACLCIPPRRRQRCDCRHCEYGSACSSKPDQHVAAIDSRQRRKWTDRSQIEQVGLSQFVHRKWQQIRILRDVQSNRNLLSYFLSRSAALFEKVEHTCSSRVEQVHQSVARIVHEHLFVERMTQ